MWNAKHVEYMTIISITLFKEVGHEEVAPCFNASTILIFLYQETLELTDEDDFDSDCEQYV